MTAPFHQPSPRELEHAVREFAAQILGALAPMVVAVEPGKLDPSKANVGVRQPMVPLVLNVAWGLAEAAVQYRYQARDVSAKSDGTAAPPPREPSTGDPLGPRPAS